VTDQPNSSDSFSDGAKAIRDTIKWLIASLGAVGAALIAGSQLSGIGKLPAHSGRLWVAIAGIVIGLAGVGLAIFSAIGVLTPEEVTLEGLAVRASLRSVRREIDAMPEIFEGFAKNIDELRDGYASALALRAEALEASIVAVDDSTLDAKAKAESVRVAQLNRVVQAVLTIGGWYQLKECLRGARRTIFLGAALAASGIGLFAWAGNPPVSSAMMQSVPSRKEPPTVEILGEPYLVVGQVGERALGGGFEYHGYNVSAGVPVYFGSVAGGIMQGAIATHVDAYLPKGYGAYVSGGISTEIIGN